MKPHTNGTDRKKDWKQEEEIAHIHGWDFSHIQGRCVEADLPWDYKRTIEQYLTADMRILDCDTGGGEFLLSLNHPHHKTAATEGYPPNAALCQRMLLPLGIDFKVCSDPANLPFPDEGFDLILNRHGSFHADELYRLLKPGGLFITQQVGEDNDRDLVELVLPNAKKPFPHFNLTEQSRVFEKAGFQLLETQEAFCPITFHDVGAFVWFARIIEWEFPDFSVDRCFDALLNLQRQIDAGTPITGTVHRYLIVAKKPLLP